MKIKVTRIQSLYGTSYGVRLGKHSYEQSLDGTLWYTKPISRGPFVPLWVELWLGLIVLTARWRGVVENVPTLLPSMRSDLPKGCWHLGRFCRPI